MQQSLSSSDSRIRWLKQHTLLALDLPTDRFDELLEGESYEALSTFVLSAPAGTSLFISTTETEEEEVEGK
jgi:hypothetical protein